MNVFDFNSFPVTLSLLLGNLVLSGYALTTAGQMDALSLQTGRVLRQHEYYRLITHGFVHADIFHFLFNMLTLYFFGPFLEQLLGSFNFAILYFGALLSAAALSLYLNRQDLSYAAVGASGAISGVILSFCLFRPFAGIYIFFIPIPVPAFLFAGIFILVSLYFMDDVRPGEARRSRIAHEAHLGGALAGIIITLILRPDALAGFISQFS